MAAVTSPRVVIVATVSGDMADLEIIGAAIDAGRALAVRADQVDWKCTSEKARVLAVSEGVGPALALVVSALGDPHTFVMAPSHDAEPAVRAARVLRPTVEERAGVAILRLPSCMCEVTSPGATEYVQAAHDGVRARSASAWLIDLRDNEGGNIFPMLSALAPFLSDGPLCGFRLRNGQSEIDRLDGSNVWCNDQKVMVHDAPPPRVDVKVRVAVVVGDRTCSAGEIAALALRARPGARYFGTRTAGLTSGNEVVDIGGGWRIAITAGTALDGGGQIYQGPIIPDIETTAADAESRALDWLVAD